MKKNIYSTAALLLLSFFILHANSSVTPVAGFGKTHFISGYDHTKTRQKKVKQKKERQNPVQVLFSPDENTCETLCNFIDHEQERIRVAIYTFTDKKVRDALIRAHNRGVKVEVVTEKTMVLERYSKIDDLADAGIAIHIYPVNKKDEKKIRGIMHNKFMIFSRTIGNKKTVWLGSYNFTKAARKYNRESVVVVQDQQAYVKCTQEFNTIKQLSKPYAIRS